MSERERVHLVLSAGGMRCISYIGALMRLEDRYEYATVSTCSAGTLVGALLCSGLKPEEMREELLRLELRDLVGEVRMRPLRELTRRARWPYALYRGTRIPQTFSEILARRRKPAHPTMGAMDPELACAAVDVASERLLAYSKRTHPDLPVEHVLRVATAVPSYFPPLAEDERSEIVDAAMTTYSPIWLATGLGDDLPVVVLRAPVPARRARRTMFPTWIGDVLQSGIASQDAYVLERSRHVRVVDIPTEVEAFDFSLSRRDVEALIDKGWAAVSEADEVREESELLDRPAPARDAEGRARDEATWLQRKHVNAGSVPDTVFISYAREDRGHVERLRRHLGDLVNDPAVTVWDDSYIRTGMDWQERITDAIVRARVAVMLVSESFMASPYIRDTELPLLRRRDPRIVWISLDGAEPYEPERRIQGFRNESGRPSDGELERLFAGAALDIKECFRPRAASGR